MQTFNQLFFKKKQIFSYFFKEISEFLKGFKHLWIIPLQTLGVDKKWERFLHLGDITTTDFIVTGIDFLYETSDRLFIGILIQHLLKFPFKQRHPSGLIKSGFTGIKFIRSVEVII